MSYRVFLSNKAGKQYKKLDPHIRVKMKSKLDGFDNPEMSSVNRYLNYTVQWRVPLHVKCAVLAVSTPRFWQKHQGQQLQHRNKANRILYTVGPCP